MTKQEKYKLLKEKYYYDDDYWQKTLEIKGLPLDTPIEKFYDLLIIDATGIVYTPSVEVMYQNGLENEANYQAYLAQQNATPQPSAQDTLNAQLLKDNASMKVEMNNQKALNSQLLLEIAKLKGGTTNV